ncbi:MAG: hypothetical protein ACJ74U_07265 [Jatrophihabitantaceae bacterium]
MSWLTEPDSEWDTPDDPSRRPDEPRSRLRLVALLLGGWLVVSVVVLLVLLAIGGRHSSGKSAGSAATTPGPAATTSSTSRPAGSATPTLPDGWLRQASDSQTDCAAHSYGQVQAFFARTPCTSVQRLLASTSQHGRTVIIASSVVNFRTAAQAQQYLGLVNADGTGNIADLLREGVTYPGGPDQLPDAAFASRLDGNRVLVAEAGYVGGTSGASDPILRSIAEEGVR